MSCEGGKKDTRSQLCTGIWPHKDLQSGVNAILTLEEHGVDDHGSVWVLHILGDLRQLAACGLGRPLVDGVHCAPLVPEIDFGVVVVVVLLAVLHKLVSEGHRAGAVEAVVDFPGGVACLGVAHLRRSGTCTPLICDIRTARSLWPVVMMVEL